MPKMNPELKSKWVAALRDPVREQIKGVLRHGNAMCCLGVLCDVIDPEEWYSHDGVRFTYGSDGDAALPPVSLGGLVDLVDLVGFAPCQETLVVNGLSAVPQKHNDEHNATFLQIADAIEEQW